MPRELLRRAIEQSEDREPLVRAMVLLHGARVLAAVDKNAARRAFAEGVTMAENLPLPAHLFELIMNEAVRLGTAADPVGAIALFRRLPITGQGPWLGSTGRMLVQSLVRSGELEIAVGLLEDLNIEVGGAEVLIHCASDLQLQRRAMAAARERWRAGRKRMRLQPLTPPQDDFYRLFSLHWRKLEPPDAENWLDEVLLAIETDPDQPTSFRFWRAHTFPFHTGRSSV